MSETTTIKHPRATKKFKALLALLDDNEAAAVATWNATNPDNPIGAPAGVSGDLKKLMDAGFTEEEAKAALKAAEDAKTQTPAEAAPLTSKEHAEAMVAKAGLVHVRGRVYVTTAHVEAQVRVMKTGKPELIRNEGSHRTKAVIIYRLDDDQTVALQNVGEQN